MAIEDSVRGAQAFVSAKTSFLGGGGDECKTGGFN